MKIKIIELIKEYPGSEKIGTRWYWDPSWGLYKTADNRFSTIWTLDYFMSGIGEFFKEIKKLPKD